MFLVSAPSKSGQVQVQESLEGHVQVSVPLPKQAARLAKHLLSRQRSDPTCFQSPGMVPIGRPCAWVYTLARHVKESGMVLRRPLACSRLQRPALSSLIAPRKRAKASLDSRARALGTHSAVTICCSTHPSCHSHAHITHP